jgi:hypothetical protein
MKRWRRNIFFLTFAVLISSCSQSFYQFPIFTSEQTKLAKLDELITEKELFTIGYSMYGHDSPLQIRITNTSTIDITVNWRNAYLSISDKTYEMASDMSKTWICSPDFIKSLNAAPDDLAISEFEQMVIANGKKEIGSPLTVIKPNETLLFNSIELQKDTLNLSQSQSQQPIEDFVIHSFDKAHAPFHFSLFLPIEVGENKIIIEDKFWISDVYSINQKEAKTPYLHKKSMNMSTVYTYKEKRGLVATGFYLTGGIIGTVAIWMSRGATYDPNEIGD